MVAIIPSGETQNPQRTRPGRIRRFAPETTIATAFPQRQKACAAPDPPASRAKGRTNQASVRRLRRSERFLLNKEGNALSARRGGKNEIQVHPSIVCSPPSTVWRFQTRLDSQTVAAWIAMLLGWSFSAPHASQARTLTVSSVQQVTDLAGSWRLPPETTPAGLDPAFRMLIGTRSWCPFPGGLRGTATTPASPGTG